jgi:hypothetical protein
MPVRTATFSSGVYKIYDRIGVAGECSFPSTDLPRSHPDRQDRSIWVSEGLSAKDELETWIHEALHAEDQLAEEKWVEPAARNIARLLWRLGYRRSKR